MHVHILCPEGEAKFWLEPLVALESSHGLRKGQLVELQKIVEERYNEIKKAWQDHFKS